MNVIQDKISSVFFQYSIPSVLGMLAISSASIVDGFFIFTLPFSFGTQGIFLAIPMAEAITFILAIILFRNFSPHKIT